MRIFLLGALCLLSEAHAQSTGVPLPCAAAPQTRSLELPKDGSDLRLSVAAGPAWLEVEESGQRVQFAGAPDESITIPQPLRHGWHWVPARSGDSVVIRRQNVLSRARGTIQATLYCSSTQQLQRKLAWLQRAGKIGASLDRPTDREHVAQTLAAIGALQDDAPTPIERAVALHYAAQLLAANSLSSEALAAFDRAERAWMALHDRERALAAHLGRIEELLSIDALQAVIEQTPDVASLHGPQSYLATRLENPRCLALQSLGRFDDAAACVDWLLKGFRALDEDEDYVAVAQNYAGVLRDRGDLQAAEDVAERSLNRVSGPEAPMLRGRLRLTLADIALRRGRLAQSFAYAELALHDFDSAQFGAATWRASALMFTAILYSQLGANDEAYGALADAVRTIAPLNMPSRMATAMNVFADIETNVRRVQSALLWRRAAEETFAGLNMASAYQSTRALRLDLQAQLGDLADIKRELPAMSTANPVHAAQMSLLSADVALHEGRLDDAHAALDRATGAPLSLRYQIRAAVLDAEYQDRRGDAAAAQRTLRASADRVDSVARLAGNPALRYVIARQLSTLRTAAYRLALAHAPASAGPGAIAPIWQWLMDPPGESATAAAGTNARATAESFDRAVALDLLSQPGRPAPPSDANAQRELLSLLAHADRSDGVPSAASTPALATLQQQLEADSALIAYADGGARGALVWISRDDVRLLAAAAPDQVRASAIALRELVRSAGASVADIRAAAQRLSAQVLGEVPATQPPRHLYVVAEEPLNGVAWSVLPWPGRSEPLLETTAVSLVHLARAADIVRPAAQVPDDLHVVVAAQSHAPGSPLRSLGAASVEATQIRKAFGDAVPRIDESTQASRDSLLTLFGEPAGWVHVAAHGTAQPQRIGYAGIWLEPPAQEAPPSFLSWLDVLDRGVRADLVVLDACQLGDSGSAVGGNLSFADAVSRAGARRVVAALWPVSDAASALWVPAFYQALLADSGHDPAQALRSAQLRLRASRAFTHPFFWAGFQSIERIDLAARSDEAP